MANKIGRRLRKLRGDKTQAEVANDLGISIAAVASYELGERVPRDKVKVKIARYYGVDVGALFF